MIRGRRLVERAQGLSICGALWCVEYKIMGWGGLASTLPAQAGCLLFSTTIER